MKKVAVIGAGPSGLEAARVLGERGYDVILAEASRDLGGRVFKESQLLGLAEWRRVTDWRITQINKLKSIEIYRESKLNIGDISDLEVDGILVATGAKWAEDALGRHSDIGFEKTDDSMIFGAEKILSGEEIHGSRIVIYDDDHYYMGSVIALHLSKRGYQVVLVTPAGRACSWGEYTDEQVSSNLALYNAGVEVITNKTIINVQNGSVQARCIYSSKIDLIECDKVIPLTRRIPRVGLYHDLIKEYQVKDDKSRLQILKIGDVDSPSHIAAAIYSGYKAAIEFGNELSSSKYSGRRENRIL